MFAITDGRCAAVIALAVFIFVDMTDRLNDVILVGAAADGAGMLRAAVLGAGRGDDRVGVLELSPIRRLPLRSTY